MRLAAAGLGMIGLAWALMFLPIGAERPPSLEVGDRAPAFHAVDVRNGSRVSLGDYEGRVVLLNLWATWCAPCREELPAMQRLHETLGGEGLRVVAISLDDAPPQLVGAFADDHAVTFDVLQDPQRRVEVTYDVSSLPQSYVIDRRGRIVSRHVGAQAWDTDFFIDRFRVLLKP